MSEEKSGEVLYDPPERGRIHVEMVYLATRDYVEVLRVEPGPRILVDGEETSDVERIGAAFVRWAKAYMAPEQGAAEGSATP